MQNAAYSAYIRLPERIQSALRGFVTRATTPSEFRPSFSRGGEDMVLRKLFEGRTQGFYVDVGAWHPWKASNTYGLYLRGWRGINIDARPGSMALFDRVRPHDTNLETAIGTNEGSANYYHFVEDTSLNSLHHTSVGSHTATRTDTVSVRRLDSVFDEHLTPTTTIDLLCVDVEGMDLDVLQSNNWAHYRPTVVVVEEQDDGPGEYLSAIGYRVVADLPVVLGECRNRVYLSGSH